MKGLCRFIIIPYEGLISGESTLTFLDDVWVKSAPMLYDGTDIFQGLGLEAPTKQGACR